MEPTQELSIYKKIDQIDPTLISNLVLNQDLAGLKPEQKVMYFKQYCESLGLNPLTKPFELIKFQGKEILYANKSCAEQLRKIYGISVIDVRRETTNDIHIVTVIVSDRTGRTDSGIGAMSIKGLSPADLAIAFMKSETKAKRRATLSIAGLGCLDETEIEDLPKGTIQNSLIATLNKTIAPVPEITESEEVAKLDINKLDAELAKVMNRDELSLLYGNYSDWQNDETLKKKFAEAGKKYPKPKTE